MRGDDILLTVTFGWNKNVGEYKTQKKNYRRNERESIQFHSTDLKRYQIKNSSFPFIK